MRLIDADALIAEYDRVHIGPPGGARKLMEDAPTINPDDLRPRGKWLENEDYVGDSYYTCSECRNDWYTVEGTPAENGMDFCPKCGAAMKGGKDINALTKTDAREEE